MEIYLQPTNLSFTISNIKHAVIKWPAANKMVQALAEDEKKWQISMLSNWVNIVLHVYEEETTYMSSGNIFWLISVNIT